jgi:hypothetical protein
MDTIRVPEAIISAMFMVTHPAQYRHAAEARHSTLTDAYVTSRWPECRKWPTVFTGISVMTNRVTPAHCDSKGENSGYDALVSVGTADAAILTLADLGATFSYPPQTVVFLTGRVLTHEVKEWGNGDRTCYAHWTRQAVFKKFGFAPTEWPTVAASQVMLNSLTI